MLRSLRGYRRSWLASDVLAAVTLLAIAVPEQLATSRLAGMPPVTGFYAFVAGTVLFALLGSNPRMSVGADSTIAPLFAVGVAGFAASGTHRLPGSGRDPGGDGRRAGGARVAGAAGLDRRAALGADHHRLPRPGSRSSSSSTSSLTCSGCIPTAARRCTGSDRSSPISATRMSRPSSSASGCSALVIAAERIDGRLPGALVGLVGATVVVADDPPEPPRRRGARARSPTARRAWGSGASRGPPSRSSRRWPASWRSSSSPSQRPRPGPLRPRSPIRRTSAATSWPWGPATWPRVWSAPFRSTPAPPGPPR